jgi:hypothetical protein
MKDHRVTGQVTYWNPRRHLGFAVTPAGEKFFIAQSDYCRPRVAGEEIKFFRPDRAAFTAPDPGDLISLVPAPPYGEGAFRAGKNWVEYQLLASAEMAVIAAKERRLELERIEEENRRREIDIQRISVILKNPRFSFEKAAAAITSPKPVAVRSVNDDRPKSARRATQRNTGVAKPKFLAGLGEISEATRAALGW